MTLVVHQGFSLDGAVFVRGDVLRGDVASKVAEHPHLGRSEFVSRVSDSAFPVAAPMPTAPAAGV